MLLKHALTFAAAAGASAAAASCAYQMAGDRRDARRFPPPGRMINVSGRAQHLWARGRGAPAVIMIPALGGSGIEWAAMQRRLGEKSTAVLYDRAGLGWSDPWGRRRDTTAMVDELHDLLQASDVEGPYVLVGGSIGGLVARLYASRFPSDVAGVVLSDSSHEEMDERIDAADPRPWYRQRWSSALRYRLKWLGVRRLAYDLGWLPKIREVEEQNVPPDLVDVAVAHELGSRNRRGVAAELAALSAGFPDVVAGRRHLGDIPLTVITGGPGNAARRNWHHVWLELQADLASQSNRATQIMALHTVHHIHKEDPELVARAIADMVDRVRDERAH